MTPPQFSKDIGDMKVKIRMTLGGLLVATTAVMVGQTQSDAVAARGGSLAGGAPDVIVGSLHEVERYGQYQGITSYSVGTTSCNQGNAYLDWESNTNSHPTIGQNAYRFTTLDNGCSRLEHIGRSFLKHGFCALQYTLCGSCSNPSGGGCDDQLGYNCSDPYDSYWNGQQNNLGPSKRVNASTGYFPYPFNAPSYQGTIGRRLQLFTDDVAPNLNPNSDYFVEGMYTHPQDAAACKGYNNASYRPITFSGSGNNGYNMNLQSTTRQMSPAIYAWSEMDPEVSVRRLSLGSCLTTGLNQSYYLATKVCDLGDGTYQYEYALYNMDCDVSFNKFELPMGENYSADQRFALYHSGEEIDNDMWSQNYDAGTGMFSFSCPNEVDDDYASAIRWNSMHGFTIITSDPPVEGSVNIGLYKTNGEEVTVSGIMVPNADVIELCAGDLTENGVVDGKDLSTVLAYWGQNTGGDVNGDGFTDGQDMAIVLGNWGCTSK
jgi:hypothetical protein